MVSSYDAGRLPLEDEPEVSTLTLEEIFIALTGRAGGGPMRGFVAVFEREFHERRLLWVVALVLSLVPVVLPLVPGLLPGGASAEDLRSGLAFGLAALLAASARAVPGRPR